MPSSGISAIGMEQPPSASVDSSSAPKAQARFFRSTAIPSGNPRFASFASQPPDTYFINYRGKRLNHSRPKRLASEHQIGPLGLQYDKTKILCRSATREKSRSSANRHR